VDIIWTILGLWLFPLQLFTVCAALYTQVKWAFWPGLVVILVVQVANLLSMVGDGYLRHYLLKAKDCRLGRCDEGFGFIRTLRMLSWEGTFGDRIMDARNEELRFQQMRLWAQKMPAALSYTLGSLVTLVTLAYYVTYYGESLKASTVLPVIGLISSLIGPLSNFPTWSNQYLVWRSAYGRLNKFMGLAVHPQREILMDFAGDSAPENAEEAAMLPDNHHEVGGFQGCTLAWPKGSSKRAETALDVDVEQPLLYPDASTLRPCLMDLNVSVIPAELLVLEGKEGQGKTSLL
jgi:ABC-type multidrug transport system fused ATPase/permease subunit